MKHTKLAYFLRGLGFGIVFVTVITTVSAKKSSNHSNTAVPIEMTKDEIIAKAKEYGMVEGVGMKVDQLLDTTPSPSPEPEQKQEKEEPTKEPKVTATPTAEPAQKVTFRVKGGQTAKEVAKALEEAGIIEDGDAFHKYLDNNGYSRKILSSEYTIKVNASYKTIAKQLTTKKK